MVSVGSTVPSVRLEISKIQASPIAKWRYFISANKYHVRGLADRLGRVPDLIPRDVANLDCVLTRNTTSVEERIGLAPFFRKSAGAGI